MPLMTKMEVKERSRIPIDAHMRCLKTEALVLLPINNNIQLIICS